MCFAPSSRISDGYMCNHWKCLTAAAISESADTETSDFRGKNRNAEQIKGYTSKLVSPFLFSQGACTVDKGCCQGGINERSEEPEPHIYEDSHLEVLNLDRRSGGPAPIIYWEFPEKRVQYWVRATIACIEQGI